MARKLRPIDIDCPETWCGAKAGEPCSRQSRVVYYCQRRRGQAELRSTDWYLKLLKERGCVPKDIQP